MIRTIKARLRYWWRKLVVSAGCCPDCGNTLNFNYRGTAFCPECGSKK